MHISTYIVSNLSTASNMRPQADPIYRIIGPNLKASDRNKRFDHNENLSKNVYETPSYCKISQMFFNNIV